jgi:uncharacterized membrane protein
MMSIPLHPMIIHFPIVMLILGVIALWISLWRPEFYGRLANYLIIGGTVLLIPTIISGLASVEYAQQHFNTPLSLIEQHQILGISTLAVFVLTSIAQFLRRRRAAKVLTGIVMILSIVGIILLVLTGTFGGQIVYP